MVPEPLPEPLPESQPSAPDLFNKRCPSRPILDLVADKWTALVMFELSTGTRRHGELRRRIGGISQKMLTQTLRELERYGLVNRTVIPTSPPTVEYALTFGEPSWARWSRRSANGRRGTAWS